MGFQFAASVLTISLGLLSSLALSNVKTEKASAQYDDIVKYCSDSLKDLPGKFSKKQVAKACAEVEVLNTCQSTKGTPIYHYDSKLSSSKANKKILI